MRQSGDPIWKKPLPKYAVWFLWVFTPRYLTPAIHNSVSLRTKADSLTNTRLEEGSAQSRPQHQLEFSQDPQMLTRDEGNSLQGPERLHLPESEVQYSLGCLRVTDFV